MTREYFRLSFENKKGFAKPGEFFTHLILNLVFTIFEKLWAENPTPKAISFCAKFNRSALKIIFKITSIALPERVFVKPGGEIKIKVLDTG